MSSVPETVDVLVVGAGLAGLHTATLLARRGHAVMLVDRRTDLTTAIRTTGIFVRKTLDDFPLPEEALGPPIRRVVLYPAGGYLGFREPGDGGRAARCGAGAGAGHRCYQPAGDHPPLGEIDRPAGV